MQVHPILTAAALAILAAPPVLAQDHRDHSHPHHEELDLHSQDAYPERPGEDFIWEEGVVRPDGEVVDGFWRKQAEPGFFWQDAGWDENGEWVDYDFIPSDDAPEGYTWEPGYRGDDGVWNLGFWRSEEREGFDWKGGAYDDGDYVQGQWEPEEEIIIEEEYIYEPGYRADTGYWIPGFVRHRDRAGFSWMPGYWDGPEWVAGYWAPTSRRHDHVWVRGHVGVDGRWVPGHWRATDRAGYGWVNGYWVADTYVWGFWRPIVATPGQVWVVGYSVGGVWYPGYWRPATRAGYYWMPGYYHRGRYTVGYWVRGRAPLHRSHRYYRRYHRHAHRVHYHHHHVVHRRAHRGPHFRSRRGAIARRSAVHQPRAYRAGAARRAAAPQYRRRSQAPGVHRRQPVQSRRAGSRIQSVRYDATRRPTRAPRNDARRATRNPDFRGTKRARVTTPRSENIRRSGTRMRGVPQRNRRVAPPSQNPGRRGNISRTRPGTRKALDRSRRATPSSTSRSRRATPPASRRGVQRPSSTRSRGVNRSSLNSRRVVRPRASASRRVRTQAPRGQVQPRRKSNLRTRSSRPATRSALPSQGARRRKSAPNRRSGAQRPAPQRRSRATSSPSRSSRRSSSGRGSGRSRRR